MADKEVLMRGNDEKVLHAIFHPHLPLQPESELLVDEAANDKTDQEIPDAFKKLEVDAVNQAQDGNLLYSLDLFNKLVKELPNYASGYNNRAQLFRIQGDNDSAYEDLNKAILLSRGKGRVASQAFVQRGLLYKLNNENEKATKDFQSAAKLGNNFAKQQITAMNPYAALCNQMLGEVFSKIYNGEPDM